MSNVGRPTLPIEQAVARGIEGARAREDIIPPRVPGIPVCPDWMPSEAKTCWASVSGVLHARGQLSLDSQLSLTALCLCYAEWVELAKTLISGGRTQEKIVGLSGNVHDVARPETVMFADCDRRLKAWLIEFGLTDASRSKVTGGAGQQQPVASPLAKYGLH